MQLNTKSNYIFIKINISLYMQQHSNLIILYFMKQIKTINIKHYNKLFQSSFSVCRINTAVLTFLFKVIHPLL